MHPGSEFRGLGLSEAVVRAVVAEGYVSPTPIQRESIPIILSGRDLLGCARTGTGKTAAFALPILDRLAADAKASARRARALVLAPTRELAAQIDESFRVYGAHLRLRRAAIFGGVNQNPQVAALRAGVEILVATPGRLMDLVQQGHLELGGIEILVLDEADRMLDMGFIHDIRKIVAKLPQRRQTLFFSATMPEEIRSLAESILRNPARVQVDPVSAPAKAIEQAVCFVPQRSKSGALRSLLAGEVSGRTLVFTRTKHGADRVVKDLLRHGVQAAAIHGNKSQNARTRALAAFKSTKPPVLVATDIASRGIDVDDITHVINFDLPVDAETYVHRIGRTARAGASGAALSLCDPGERPMLRSIERLTGVKIAVRGDLSVEAADELHGTDVGRGETSGDRRSARSKERGRSSAGPARGRGAGHSKHVPRGGGHQSEARREPTRRVADVSILGTQRRVDAGPREERGSTQGGKGIASSKASTGSISAVPSRVGGSGGWHRPRRQQRAR